MFQSLCRGEASATLADIRTPEDAVEAFQSLCRGEASATAAAFGKDIDDILAVSIPLSRGSLCNCTKPISDIPDYCGFNPSVEGKPLQRTITLSCVSYGMGFNPSVEGKPLQPLILSAVVSACPSFNPSVEGKPLQPDLTDLTDLTD